MSPSREGKKKQQEFWFKNVLFDFPGFNR